jgi:hypothetical protein
MLWVWSVRGLPSSKEELAYDCPRVGFQALGPRSPHTYYDVRAMAQVVVCDNDNDDGWGGVAPKESDSL